MRAVHLVIGAAVALAVVFAWVMRYDIKVGSRGDGAPTAFVLDRWTGNVEVHYFNAEYLKSQPRPPARP